MNDNDKSLRDHLLNLLEAGDAHIKFDDAVADFPPELRGKRAPGAPHTAWQLLEHLRLAQWDILEFTRDPKHVSPEFPAGYWPETEAPPDDKAWEKSVESFRRDLKGLAALLRDASIDLHARLPHGDGQTVLREILVAADHNAYHLGQLMFVKRMLEA